MNRNLLIDYLNTNSLNLDDLVGFYSFDSYSGQYTFNDKNTYSSQDSKKASESYPLISLCDSDNVNTVSGSGYFDGNTIAKVGTEFKNEDWTILLNYYTSDFASNRNLGRTLFSSMKSGTSASGFNVGLNGAHKLYFEYYNKDSQRKTFTLDCELGEKNIISVVRSKASNSVTMSFYDELYKNEKRETFSTADSITSTSTDTILSNDLYVGDFYSASNGYTGFSGYYDDLIIFKNAIASGTTKNLANLMIASGYTSGGLTAEQFTFSGATGLPTLTSGVTGQGITGYRQVQSGVISSRCGADIPIYVNSGVSGDKTGTTITYSYSTGLLTGTRTVFAKPSINIDNSLLEKYKRKNITLFYDVSDLIDNVEVRSFTGINSDVGIQAEPVFSSTGKYNLGTGYTGSNINFYLNGLYQRSGASHDFYKTGTNEIVPTGGIQDSGIYHSNIYDKVTGTANFTGYESGNTIYSKQIIAWEHKDLYINGLKMLSGTDHIWYEGAHDSVNIDRSKLHGLPTGEIALVSFIKHDHRFVELNNSLISNPSGFLSPQVWYNGQRIIINKNYKLVSDNSLLANDNKIRFVDSFSVYNGEEQGF